MAFGKSSPCHSLPPFHRREIPGATSDAGLGEKAVPDKLLQIPIRSRTRNAHKVPVFFRAHATLKATWSGIQYPIHSLALSLV